MSTKPLRPARPVPTRLALVLCALVLAAAVPGCGGGYGYVDAYDYSDYGTLEVANEAWFAEVWAVDVTPSYGGPLWSYDVWIPPGDWAVIDDFYDDVYDVEVYWDDGTADLYYDVDIWAGDVTTLYVG